MPILSFNCEGKTYIHISSSSKSREQELWMETSIELSDNNNAWTSDGNILYGHCTPLSSIRLNSWCDSISDMAFIIAGDKLAPIESRDKRKDVILCFSSDDVLPGYANSIRKARYNTCACMSCKNSGCSRCSYNYDTYISSIISEPSTKTIFGVSNERLNMSVHTDLVYNDIITFMASMLAEIRTMFFNDFKTENMNLINYSGAGFMEDYSWIPDKSVYWNYVDMFINMITTVKTMCKSMFTLDPNKPEGHRSSACEYIMYHNIVTFIREKYEIDYSDSCMVSIMDMALLSENLVVNLVLPIPLSYLFERLHKLRLDHEYKESVIMRKKFESFMTVYDDENFRLASNPIEHYLLDPKAQFRESRKKIDRTLYFLALCDKEVYIRLKEDSNCASLQAYQILIDVLVDMQVIPRTLESKAKVSLSDIDVGFMQTIIEFVCKFHTSITQQYAWIHQEVVRFFEVKRIIEKHIMKGRDDLTTIICTGADYQKFIPIHIDMVGSAHKKDRSRTFIKPKIQKRKIWAQDINSFRRSKRRKGMDTEERTDFLTRISTAILTDESISGESDYDESETD